MKKIVPILAFLAITSLSAQTSEAFEAGEWFKFRIHYGWFNASFATLEVEEAQLRGKSVYHIKGHGESTGLLDLFFEVDDTYRTYIDPDTGLPMRFIRNINEGGYEKNRRIDFDQQTNVAVVTDYLKNSTKTFETKNKVQDMLSVLYFLRNKINGMELEPGDEIEVNMFFDDENYRFLCKFLGVDILKTEFGKVRSLKFRPYVQSARVYKEKESLTFWVTADKNKAPIKIEADLAVGSLEADLIGFKGLKHPFEIIMD
jgi:hypothetical protein